jgi:hypothetical protein
MYEFKHERERKDKIFKGYIYLYLFIFLITVSHTLFTKNITFQVIASVLFHLFVFWLALKRNPWGVFFLKLYVWMNIIILVLMAASYFFTYVT